MYLGDTPHPTDTHSFRFSANTLQGLLEKTGFEVAHTNRYFDSDILAMVGKKNSGAFKRTNAKDNYLDVFNFFERWHVETKIYYPQ